MAQNVSNIARKAQFTMEDAQAANQAIKAGLDPMLSDIEVQSGMVRGANVLPNRLFTSGTGDTMGTYYAALASKLPAYVNTRRAYDEEQKKKNAGSSSGGTFQFPNFDFPTIDLLPPQYYLPMTSTGVRGRTGPAYGTSPYGAIPMGVITSAQPASRTLAERKYGMTQKKQAL